MFICVTIHKLMSMSVHLLGSVILSPDSASLCLWQLDYQFISKKLIIISFVKSPLLDFDNYSASNYFFPLVYCTLVSSGNKKLSSSTKKCGHE